MRRQYRSLPKFDREERHFNEAVKALPANEVEPPLTDFPTNPSIHREAH